MLAHFASRADGRCVRDAQILSSRVTVIDHTELQVCYDLKFWHTYQLRLFEMLALLQRICNCVMGSQDGIQTQWDVALIAQLVATSVYQNGISMVHSAC